MSEETKQLDKKILREERVKLHPQNMNLCILDINGSPTQLITQPITSFPADITVRLEAPDDYFSNYKIVRVGPYGSVPVCEYNISGEELALKAYGQYLERLRDGDYGYTVFMKDRISFSRPLEWDKKEELGLKPGENIRLKEGE